MDEEYIKMVKTLSVYPEIIEKQNDLKIVYTPIHGTGITLGATGFGALWF